MDPSTHNHAEHAQGTSLFTWLALSGAAVAGGIILAPYVLPAVGIGSIDIAENTLSSFHNLPDGVGLADAINRVLKCAPFIGDKLAEGGTFNVMATAFTGLGGVTLGNWMSKKHEGKSGTDWGKVIKWASLATSALIALPSILTGLSTGLAYLLNEAVSLGWIDTKLGGGWMKEIMEHIGVTPYHDAVHPGFTGAAATLPHLLTCGLSFFPLMASVGADKWLSNKPYVALNTKGEPLPEHDRNHLMTQDEIALTERYNQASPAQKVILKKEILEKGYEPDFHDDGSIHLYKHTHEPQSVAR